MSYIKITHQIDISYNRLVFKADVWRYVLCDILQETFCSVLKCRALYFLCRDSEPAENNLKDMLHQLNSIIAAKPSEKAVICQGERRLLSLHDKSFFVLFFFSFSDPHFRDLIFVPVSVSLFCLCVSRRGRGSCMYSHLLDQQMGWLLWQIWTG